jgi:hypothetical protein
MLNNDRWMSIWRVLKNIIPLAINRRLQYALLLFFVEILEKPPSTRVRSVVWEDEKDVIILVSPFSPTRFVFWGSFLYNFALKSLRVGWVNYLWVLKWNWVKYLLPERKLLTIYKSNYYEGFYLWIFSNFLEFYPKLLELSKFEWKIQYFSITKTFISYCYSAI